VDKEEWRQAVSWEGIYDISNLGRARRAKPGKNTFTGRILKPCFNTGKYLCVDFREKGRRKYYPLHCLVAAAFIGPRLDGLEINHIDGNKTNNRVDNLEYITHRENLAHAIRLGLISGSFAGMIGAMSSCSKLTEDGVRQIRRLIKEGEFTQKEIGLMYGVCQVNISHIKLNKLWSHIK